MRLELGDLVLGTEHAGGREIVFIKTRTALVTMSIEELRWLCLVAGPAVLSAASSEAAVRGTCALPTARDPDR